MGLDAAVWIVQGLNGLASASTLFLVAVGLSLIFGVSRIVNFAHGSFFMLGLYTAYTLVARVAPVLDAWVGVGWGYWLVLPLAAVFTGLLGALIEVLLLRRLYASAELFQLLATFALVLVLQDVVLWLWGPQDVLGPRAPGLAFSVSLLERRIPAYDLFLVAVGPVVLAGVLWLLHRTRWGLLVRAATQDRQMVAALGVRQSRLFTGVFALGCALAGLGGALQLPREPAHLGLDLSIIGDAFVVVVVGGLGSVSGAYLAALLIGLTKALCTALGVVQWGGWSLSLSKFTLVVEFVVMAGVLVWRPWGLLGREQAPQRDVATHPGATLAARWHPALGWTGLLVVATLPLWSPSAPYMTILAIDMLTAVLMACSLYWLMGPVGLHSFGHAAWFGLGAYGAAMLSVQAGLSMGWALLVSPFVAAAVAACLAWFCLRLSGVYLAMLTLAIGQIVWSIAFQWDDVTGGSNGLTGIWPEPWAQDKNHYYVLCLVLVGLSVWALQRLAQSPLGWMLRASRDSLTRAQAIGIPVKRLQGLAFVLSAGFAGLSGGLFAFSKGSISPDVLDVTRSVDALVMVLLGGLQSLAGPIWGAVVFTGLHDTLARSTEYWRAVLGVTMLALILLLPQGLGSWIHAGRAHVRARPPMPRAGGMP